MVDAGLVGVVDGVGMGHTQVIGPEHPDDRVYKGKNGAVGLVCHRCNDFRAYDGPPGTYVFWCMCYRPLPAVESVEHLEERQAAWRAERGIGDILK